MLSPEIQKNILNESIDENKENHSLLNLKKQRQRTKPKKSSLNNRKCANKKLTQKNNENQPNLFVDELSLDTNSTLITLEEEPNNNEEEDLMQYLDEIELVLKDIYSKGIYMKNFINLVKAKIGGTQITEKNVDVKLTTENYKNIINSESFWEKINLVLDIDETLVFSKMVKELKKDEDHDEELSMLKEDCSKDDIYYIKLDTNKRKFIYKVQVRKNMAYFFRKLSPFCNFYINTMATPLYVNEVINILYRNYGFKLSKINESNALYTSPLKKKTLPSEITKKDNFLILDDNICAWDIAYIPSIIPVRKFHGIFSSDSEIKNIYYQYYLFTNKIYCLDELKRPFIDELSKVPFCVEFSKNEKSQLYHIVEIIKKSFVLSKILNIPIRHALHLIQNTVLKDTFIYYEGYDKTFVYEIINLLGGSVVKDIKYATHIISNKCDSSNKVEDNADSTNKKILDIQLIFDCFFNYKKFNI